MRRVSSMPAPHPDAKRANTRTAKRHTQINAHAFIDAMPRSGSIFIINLFSLFVNLYKQTNFGAAAGEERTQKQNGENGGGLTPAASFALIIGLLRQRNNRRKACRLLFAVRKKFCLWRICPPSLSALIKERRTLLRVRLSTFRRECRKAFFWNFCRMNF